MAGGWAARKRGTRQVADRAPGGMTGGTTPANKGSCANDILPRRHTFKKKREDLKMKRREFLRKSCYLAGGWCNLNFRNEFGCPTLSSFERVGRSSLDCDPI